MTGTGTYANKQLTPSQTELISFLGQLEASSSCWEEEESFRITIKSKKKRREKKSKAALGRLRRAALLQHQSAAPCHAGVSPRCFQKHPSMPPWVGVCRGACHRYLLGVVGTCQPAAARSSIMQQSSSALQGCSTQGAAVPQASTVPVSLPPCSLLSSPRQEHK